MSYIPEVRDAKTVNLYSGKEEPNYYWEGLLSEKDRTDLNIYDMAIEQMECSMDNIISEIERDEAVDTIAKLETEIIEVAFGNLKNAMEIFRNEFVVSMRDSESIEGEEE